MVPPVPAIPGSKNRSRGLAARWGRKPEACGPARPAEREERERVMEEIVPKIEKANQEAVRRILAGDPVWEDVRPAREVIPGMTENTILHAGPPVTWDRMAGPMR